MEERRSRRGNGAVGWEGAMAVDVLGFAFEVTDWDEAPRSEHAGERGVAVWWTREFGACRVRMLEFSPGYVSDHWCAKGHIGLCVEGELEVELRDGRVFSVGVGTSFQVADGGEEHRVRTVLGARVIAVD
jgi:hypothetical protein